MLKRARMIADLQFGRGCGRALFGEDTTFMLSNTGRLRHLYRDGERTATVRARDGLLTLSSLGAELLYDFLPSPKQRVVVQNDVAPYVARGGTAFAKHVVSVDPDIRAGEEVLVVDEDGRLIATGRAVLSPEEMMELRRGPAVIVRSGQEEE
ncbi:PUA domain-containing protein [Candidatus Methanocrinis natronophilus]|uniref:Pseudouridine synthase n=1 Tax=Candidatus Methanocrinis natronophilus TaxID=3033396 RepID=A0ABT5X8P4_9EURY|nr:PUA domain-containing protein [Candidatus Methanocrinis natronophilus]MDF0591028.1 pseudouridine synthase [Candidatus Methanocrinis natronophilus]